jgi:hypothetical protein
VAQPWTATPPFQSAVGLPPQEKSSGIALLLAILWPGSGHLYLGLTKKAIPYVVANAVGLVLGLMSVVFFFIFVPITFLIWLVTLCMTVGSVNEDTNLVNDALRRGQRING